MGRKSIIYSVSLFAALSLLVGCWCLAESFLVESRPVVRRKTVNNLKQETAELLANTLEQMISNIQVAAQVQKGLFNTIRDFADNNKQRYIVKTSSKQDLQTCVIYLQEVNKKLMTYQQEMARLLNFLNSGCKSQLSEKSHK